MEHPQGAKICPGACKPTHWRSGIRKPGVRHPHCIAGSQKRRTRHRWSVFLSPGSWPSHGPGVFSALRQYLTAAPARSHSQNRRKTRYFHCFRSYQPGQILLFIPLQTPSFLKKRKKSPARSCLIGKTFRSRCPGKTECERISIDMGRKDGNLSPMTYIELSHNLYQRLVEKSCSDFCVANPLSTALSTNLL